MPRPSRPWLRLYVETPRDLKIRSLSPTHRWLWVCVLTAARESPRPGHLFFAENEPVSSQLLADLAAVRVQDVRSGMAAMERLGLVSIDDDSGAWVVPRWSERQYESDDVTKRTRKHRSRERSNEHGGNVPTSFPGTDQRTETENRTNTSTRAEPFAADFAACWELFPRREGRAAALRAYTARRRAGASADDLLTATKHYAAAVAGTERRFVKLGSTFYGRDEPWRDHLTAPVEPDPYAEQEVTYR